jgi:hypothetical protein
MSKETCRAFSPHIFLVTVLVILNLSVSGQEISKESPVLPENIKSIVSFSCMPCHSDKGGLLARGKLNFTEWTTYSLKKQKEKAEKMYSEVKKGAMPPKSVRETRPEIIPTGEQANSIKKWADSLSPDDK